MKGKKGEWVKHSEFNFLKVWNIFHNNKNLSKRISTISFFTYHFICHAGKIFVLFN